MAGLNLRANGGVSAQAGNGFSSTPAPSSASEAGFGIATTPGAPSATNALFPNDPFGVAFWTGVAALGLLLFIRHTLPA